jgi:hypothetical protein
MSRGRADDDFRSIVDDGECANPRNELEIIEHIRRDLKTHTKRFLKVSEPYISRYSGRYDGSSSRQMASSLGGNVGLE